MLVPWSYVKSWSCLACGHCCKDYAIPLVEDEWLGFSSIFGSGAVEQMHGKNYLRRQANGKCIFQQISEGRWLCGIQDVKPMSCRLFPFKICFKPLYGREGESFFPYAGKRVHIYVDVDCRGIEWGKPKAELVRKVLPEFVGLRMKEASRQFYSTANTLSQKSLLPVRSIFSACDRMDLPLVVME